MVLALGSRLGGNLSKRLIGDRMLISWSRSPGMRHPISGIAGPPNFSANKRKGAQILHTVFFITHPDVRIDPSVPVPEWPLKERGQARMRALAARPWVQGVRSIFASGERKARDAAQLLADGLGLDGYRIIDSLAENDRSATGYLPQQEFEAMVDAFFAQPLRSVRGWETAAHAQTRIIQAIEVVLRTTEMGDIAIVGHGGTGTLLYCHLADVPICRHHEQPPTNGGNWFAFDRTSRKLLHARWRSIDAPISEG